jgi:hypothetical protein
MKRFNVRRAFELASEEETKVEHVVPNVLSWVRCHRLAAASRSTSRFSCVPAFLISATTIVRAAWSHPCLAAA